MDERLWKVEQSFQIKIGDEASQFANMARGKDGEVDLDM